MEKGDHDTTVEIVDLTSKEKNGRSPLLADPVGSESTAVDIESTSKEEKGKAPLLAAAPVFTRGKRGKSPLLAASVFAPPAGIKAERTAKVGYRRGVAMFDLVLRLGALIAALTATVIMGTTDQTLPFFTQFFQFSASYDDLPAFTFFVIGNAIVSAYLVLSIPFSIVCIVRPHAAKPRLLLIICDMVMVTLITSAAASATAIVYLAHNGNSNANWLPICQQFNDFCSRVSGAVVSSFIAVLLFIFMIFFFWFCSLMTLIV